MFHLPHLRTNLYLKTENTCLSMNGNELRLCRRRGVKVDGVASFGIDNIMTTVLHHVCWLCIESIYTASHVPAIVFLKEEVEKGENPRRCVAQELQSFTCPIPFHFKFESGTCLSMNGNQLPLCVQYFEAQPSQRRQRRAKVDSVASPGIDDIMATAHHVCRLCIESIDTAMF